MQPEPPALPAPFALPLLVLLLLFLLLGSVDAHAQWLWRDKDGRVNASDRPPPREVPEKDIIGRPPADARRAAAVSSNPASGAAAVAAPAAASGPLDRELEARKRAAELEASNKTRADEERLASQRADNCRRARGHLAALDSGQRMARVNDRGENEVLDDRARADESRRARAVIASDCR